MITAFRRYLETWPVRLFFALMVAAFVVWGVGDVVRIIGTKTWLAKAGGQTIEPQQFQPTFQRELAQAQRGLPPGQDMTPAMRREVAARALQQMVEQVAVTREEQRLRVVVPDAALREAVFAMPAFRDKSGQFDRAALDQVLRANNLNEGEFLSLMRADLARAQILDAVTAGAAPPDTLVRAVFAFETERRSASLIELPFAAAPAPTESELRRWYANHTDQFRVP
ncbi:MAG: SurA N-terminal domain-containing protein, partial [Acetobacteraceae bacterium]|nr:SurA N-terminal domain-containing protein [Acetobacteraceae bacterium]